MGRKQFQSALNRNEVKVAEFDDGRSFEFPGDVGAEGMMRFLEQFGDSTDFKDLPSNAVPAFYRIVLGDKYETVIADMSISELNDVAGWLIAEYGLGEGAGAAVAEAEAKHQADKDDEPPKA